MGQWRAALALLLFTLTTALGSGTPPGWRMKDRFAGFRFECSGRFDREAWAVRVRDYAEEISGFGWVQLSPAGTVVGEYRGGKVTGPWMREFLDSGPEEASDGFVCKVHEYADTKIRFHFSHFLIMDPRRRSCFKNAPHACSGVDDAASEPPKPREEL